MFSISKNSHYQFIILIMIILNLKLVISGTCKGCLELDEYNFDKIVKQFQVVIVKFDIAFPYGEKHEIYERFSMEMGKSVNELAVTVVGVKDYGEKENLKLSQRYDVKEKYPNIKVFKNGITDQWHDYPEDLEITVENLKTFIRDHTNLYIGLPGCLREFDEMAFKFIRSVNSKQSESTDTATPDILIITEKLMDSLTDPEDKISAKVYIGIMKRIIDKGLTFVNGEIQRVTSLLNGKISDKKKDELQLRINVLRTFQSPRNTKSDAIITTTEKIENIKSEL